ncbi:MAG: hypothetical protein ANABAC_1513 [Anaerolineae bacterium]|nr:MAG: hypothetical protein ANABAC_1513 [Anaerolineae bacterium]
MNEKAGRFFVRNQQKSAGQATRRHPEGPAYRCFLSDLTGFAGFRRAGPTRTHPGIYREP